MDSSRNFMDSPGRNHRGTQAMGSPSFSRHRRRWARHYLVITSFVFQFFFFFVCAIVIYLFKRNPYSFLFMRFSFLFPLFYGVRWSGFGLILSNFWHIATPSFGLWFFASTGNVTGKNHGYCNLTSELSVFNEGQVFPTVGLKPNVFSFLVSKRISLLPCSLSWCHSFKMCDQ
jgi:hypothetical protein